MEFDAAMMDSEEDLCELLWNDFQDILLCEKKNKTTQKRARCYKVYVVYYVLC